MSTVSDEQAWLYLFTALCSMRFHPRNVSEITVGEDEQLEVDFASDVADAALASFRRRFP